MALLRAERITKSYPGVEALTDVGLQVEAGEIHALLGENGAGKSTLMEVIAGTVRPEAGHLVVDGTEVELGAPASSSAHGIGLVYQETSLVGTLSVAENVLLGRWPTRRGQVDWAALRADAERHLRRVGLDVDARRQVRELGMAERQLVELAKVLSRDVKVLLLDEPTSALSDRETRRLFEICRALRDDHVAIVYVSHRLSEIVEICDRVTVLRDGRNVDTVPAVGIEESHLARLMVGGERLRTEPAGRTGTRPRDATGFAMRVRGLARPPRLKPIDLDLPAGEITAVFGLTGAGRTRLARTLFGLDPATEGTIEVLGALRRVGSPMHAIAAGIGYVGEDRASGLVPRLSVAANITLAPGHRSGRAGLLDFKREREVAAQAISKLGIRVSSSDQPAGTLSGGNQQKVVLARWSSAGARVLILDDPTRGIDVGAKAEIFRLIRELADTGVAVLFFTSEMSEARAVAERILVMSDGRIAAELASDAPDERIMAAAGGAHV